jgi:cytochrome c-type biogenesis protein CcmF
LITQKSRGTLVRWNLFLAPITFALVLYATFLTRSGILAESSVHSFTDTGLGPFLVGVVVVSVLVTLWLLATRIKEIPDPTIYDKYISRDFAMLLTVLVVLVMAGVILVGTSTPIVTKASLRPDFYNATSSPLALVLAIILCFCPLLAWRESDMGRLARGVAAPALVGAVALVIGLILGVTQPVALGVVGFGFFAAAMNVAMIVRIYKAGIWKLGGYIAHVGVGLILVGIVGSGAYGQTEQLLLNEGQTGQALGYSFTFNGLYMAEGSDRAVLRLSATRGSESFVAEPVMIASRDGIVRNPFIQRHLTEDIYVSPGDYTPEDAGGATAQLAKGQSSQLGDYAVTFLGFDVGAHDQTGATAVAAVLQISGTKGSGIISPTIAAGASGLEAGPPVKLPGSEVTVVLSALDASGGQITLTFEGLPGVVQQAVPASASFEISRKPAINLLWLGTILLMAGTAIAVQRRRLELTAVPVSKPEALTQQAPSPAEARRRRRLEERRQGHHDGT